MSRRPLLALVGALVFACGEPDGGARNADGEAPAAGVDDALAFGSVEEMELELETLGNEIAGLEEYLEANPEWTPAEDTDPHPRAVLEAARATRDAAERALSAADTSRAADSLRAAAARIEHAKRLLFVAEEMGIEFEPAESFPTD